MDAFLSELLSSRSVSGNEGQAAAVVEKYLRTHQMQVRYDGAGNLYAARELRPGGVLLAAHMDEIGLMVTCIMEDGTLRVCAVGGVYLPMYFGHPVQVHTRHGVLYASVSVNHGLYSQTEYKATDLILDIGARDARQAAEWVEPGDIVTPDSDFRVLKNDRICGRALDDKIGVYVLSQVLCRLKKTAPSLPVCLCATVGEETVKNGACWAAANHRPKLAVVVDVTYTSDYQHGSPKAECGEVLLGGGPVVCINPICKRSRVQELRQVAQEAGLPLQCEVSGSTTHTDADKLHAAAQGAEILLVSLPMRYMHSACETVSMQDVESCIRLLTAYLDKHAGDFF